MNLGTKLLLSCEFCAALRAPEPAVFCLWHVVTPVSERTTGKKINESPKINPACAQTLTNSLSITTSGARASHQGQSGPLPISPSGEPIQPPLPARTRQGVRYQPRSGKFPSQIGGNSTKVLRGNASLQRKKGKVHLPPQRGFRRRTTKAFSSILDARDDDSH